MKTVAVQLLARYNLRSAKLEEAAVFAWLVSQQYCSLILNQHQPPATSQQYYSLITNQHQPPDTTKRTQRICTSNPKQKAKSNLHSHIITCCVLLNYNINNTMNKGSRPSIYQHGSFYLLLRLEGTFLQSKGQITGTPKLD